MRRSPPSEAEWVTSSGAAKMLGVSQVTFKKALPHLRVRSMLIPGTRWPKYYVADVRAALARIREQSGVDVRQADGSETARTAT